MSYYSQFHTPHPSPSAQVYESIINAQKNSGDQSFVEWFSGDALDTIWTEIELGGTGGSATMVDAVNEGFECTCGTTANDRYGISFNNKRQFDVRSFTFIVEMRNVSAVEQGAQTVMSDDDTTAGPERIGVMQWEDSTVEETILTTYDGVTASSTQINTVIDTNWHTYQCVGDATAGKAWYDGDFGAIKTTDLPASQKVQPVFEALSRNATGGKSSRIRYLECWNN